MLKVMSDEDIPADLLTLYCHLEDNVCYIKTTNLDGELGSPRMQQHPPASRWSSSCSVDKGHCSVAKGHCSVAKGHSTPCLLCRSDAHGMHNVPLEGGLGSHTTHGVSAPADQRAQQRSSHRAQPLLKLCTLPVPAGETNLKVRRPLNIKGRVPGSPEAVANMSVTLACEPPNNNLHYFVGRAVVQVGVQGSLFWAVLAFCRTDVDHV